MRNRAKLVVAALAACALLIPASSATAQSGGCGTANPNRPTEWMAYDEAHRGGVFVAMGDLDGDGCDEIITSPDAGGGPHVKAFNGFTGATIASFMAYHPDFRGGVRVATADADGDGNDELITAAGPGGGPHVRVWNIDGGSIVEMFGFYAYDPAFTGGVYVAGGPLFHNSGTSTPGPDEIVTGPGGAPRTPAGGVDPTGEVRIFSPDGTQRAQFRPFAPFTGSARVAIGGVNAGGNTALITGTGPDRNMVRVTDIVPNGGICFNVPFANTEHCRSREWPTYDAEFRGGILVGGLQAFNGETPDGTFVGTGPDNGGGPHVRIWDEGTVVFEFMAYDPNFRGGTRLAFGDVDQAPNGPEIVTGAGPGGGPHIRVITL